MLKGVFKEKSVGVKFLILLIIVLFCYSISSILGAIIISFIFSIEISSVLFLLSEINEKSINALKIFQTINMIGVFILPSILYRILCGFSFNLKSFPNRQNTLLSISILIFSFPVVIFLNDINKTIELFDWMVHFEKEANEIAELFLNMNSLNDLIINLIVMSLVPAIGEELFFRGIIQKNMIIWIKKKHFAIFFTAALFSIMHLQFSGFLPRLFLGLILGYLFFWSKNLWGPILIHFINNGIIVLFSFNQKSKVYYLYEKVNIYEVILSFSAVIILFYLLRKININKTLF